ncbi:domain of Kin17 curved DNA-binding protein-domain-containing protein [Dactylonectria estremocensis]|uniref:Domain of Kin17 curved DNA-binding protein-domain-containing protein n=1 Tax=Dactylonectria estremocensis TaxID=1079267 RepID=A0A9P9F422_9HYPO|nr:domain of Kin17 curved DNA-binding protein-domain-containing protein [Dactylonectria estremocensis]
MGKAEVGSTKYVANRMKSKGLQRLRWYCQVCEKQCRDANGFKMHTQSESHVRQMLVVGEDPKKFINDFSKQFQSDFLLLLRTGHGEKQVNMNRFYQEYIANKEHVHMNSTKWPSLTEFAKHLGREGICRVEENDKGLHITWIDNSPEALRRKDALRRKEAQDQGNEELEQRMIKEQIRRAQATVGAKDDQAEEDIEARELKRQDGEKIKLLFGAKPAPTSETPTPTFTDTGAEASKSTDANTNPEKTEGSGAAPAKPSGFGGISMKLGGKPQTKNVFAQAKKNALSSGSKKNAMVEQPKKMSEAERIMKEEMEKKRSRSSAGFSMPTGKKQRNS